VELNELLAPSLSTSTIYSASPALGAITFKSIAPALAAGRYSDSIVQYIVEPPRVKHDDYVSTAMEDMEKSGITMALVTKDGDVTGMITLTDILEEILDIKV